MDTKLTEEQKALIEDNINLVYGYCAKHKLDVDEYFGVLAEALCTAVRYYDPSKSKLSTYVYQCFGMKLFIDHRNATTRSRDASKNNISVIPLDIDIQDGDGQPMPLADVISDNNDDTATVDLIDLVEHCIAPYNDRYKRIVWLMIDGYPGYEIAKMVGVSPSYVSVVLYRFRNRFRSMLDITR